MRRCRCWRTPASRPVLVSHGWIRASPSGRCRGACSPRPFAHCEASSGRKIRPVVIGVEIWQSLTDPPAAGVVDGVAIAAVLAVSLVLTYAWPQMTRGWDQALEREGEKALIERGLGRPLATFLRRLPQTPSVIERTWTLDPPARTRPVLRGVGS